MLQHYNTHPVNKPYFSPPLSTYKNTRQTKYPVLPYFTALVLCVLAIAWLNTQANTAAARGHQAWCEIARENCDPFYQQTNPN